MNKTEGHEHFFTFSPLETTESPLQGNLQSNYSAGFKYRQNVSFLDNIKFII